MKYISYTIAMSVFGLFLVQPHRANAQNLPPPLNPILDLAGQALPTAYTNYTATFTASSTLTDLTFAFRNDPGFTTMDDVSTIDTTTSSGNLVVNGGFESGLSSWTYDNVFGASFGGYVDTVQNCGSISNNNTGLGPRTGLNEWCDGATQAYDAIDQLIPTTVGDSYSVSFWLDQANVNAVGQTIFQDLSTNGAAGTGGNGIDVLVYAQSGLPAPGTPEPATLLLFGTGLLGIGLARRRYTKR
jgi:hypothetical protein